MKLSQKLSEQIYEIKSLIGLYESYANSNPENEQELKTLKQEMHFTKEQILRLILRIKQDAKNFEKLLENGT